MPAKNLSYALLVSWLSVDELGVLRWRESPRNGVKKDAVAGNVQLNGYLQVGVAGQHYYAHRIVWLLTHGRWPVEEIDHINGDRTDNRLVNLRDVSHRGNQQNSPIHREGKPPGTCKQGGRWRARIQIDGKRRHLGMFDTEEEAHAAYMRACDHIGGDQT